MRRAGLIVIGNEILYGSVRERNISILARMLSRRGILLARVVIIRDSAEEIASEISVFQPEYDLVFTSGGIGPTHDDVTLLGVAKGLDVPLVSSKILERYIRRHFGPNVTDVHLRLARVPKGSSVIEGKRLFFPIIHWKNIYMLPGIPALFRRHAACILRGVLSDSTALIERIWHTEEVKIASVLEDCVAQYPQLEFGSYPVISHGKMSVRITIRGPVASDCRRAMETLTWKLQDIGIRN